MKTILIALIFLCQVSCFDLHGCEESVVNESTSPNGHAVARFLLRNCGATTDYSSVVRVSAPEDLNLKEDEVLISAGNRDISLYWQDNATLRILCKNCAADLIFKQSQSIRGISLLYR